MSIYDTIQADWKDAFKARDLVKKDFLAFLKSEIQNLAIDRWNQPDDEAIISLLKKELKTRKEALEFLEKAGDTEGVAKEKEIIAILKEYLPPVMSKEETKEKLLEMIERLGITDIAKQRWTIMSGMINQYGSSVDGGVLNQLVQEML